MISDWMASTWVKMAGVSVISSVPGRLRIRFAGGAKAWKYLQKRKDVPPKVALYKLSGIESFNFNPITSRALILYDPEVVKEQEIINWLNCLQRLIIQAIIAGEKHVDQAAVDRIALKLKEEGYELERFEQTTTA